MPPRLLAVFSITAPRIFVAPIWVVGFVRSWTQGCVFDPIATFVIAPQVFGAAYVRYVIMPAVVPQTRRPLLPVFSHAKSTGRSDPPSVAPSWVIGFPH